MPASSKAPLLVQLLCVIDTSDLKTLELANSLDKYADDTYLIVPASHSHTIFGELDNVSAWAAVNNLSLNVNNSCEMIVRRPRLAMNDPIIPPALPGVKRLESSFGVSGGVLSWLSSFLDGRT